PAFGVTWIDVGYYYTHVDKLNTFQLILIDRSDRAPDDFDIEFNYDKIEWETGDASGGENGYGGTSARAGFSNGTGEPGTFYELEGSGVHGAFLDSSPTGLIYRNHNSPITGRNTYRVESGIPEIPSALALYIEAGSTVDSWDSDSNSWTAGSHNLDTDPIFIDGYYLSQIAAGQPNDSPCVDTGSVDVTSVGLCGHTTRNDWIIDTGVVDRGYHYRLPADLTGDFDIDGDVDFIDVAIFVEYYLSTDCSAPCWCRGTDLNHDGVVNLVDYALLGNNFKRNEYMPPQPDPMTWEIEPTSVYGASWITMTATRAGDNYTSPGRIEYYFQRTDANGYPDGHFRNWGPDRIFLEEGLTTGTQYGYRVKARDAAGNETGWSDIEFATVGRETDPPTPDPMAWWTAPYATSTTSISMVATTATDVSGGVEYYFECLTGGGHDSDWITTPEYEDTGLEPNTPYTYRVRARDMFDNRGDFSAEASVATPEGDPNDPGDDETPPSPAPIIESAVWQYDTGTGLYHLFLTATPPTIVSDPSGGVQYHFYCSTNNDFSSSWQSSNTYDVIVGTFKQNLVWQVRARDQYENMTPLSEPYYVTMY
ncbi:MAG: nidogen-like domain-containing protein, partial [Planctomycetota bacterium]